MVTQVKQQCECIQYLRCATRNICIWNVILAINRGPFVVQHSIDGAWAYNFLVTVDGSLIYAHHYIMRVDRLPIASSAKKPEQLETQSFELQFRRQENERTHFFKIPELPTMAHVLCNGTTLWVGRIYEQTSSSWGELYTTQDRSIVKIKFTFDTSRVVKGWCPLKLSAKMQNGQD